MDDTLLLRQENCSGKYQFPFLRAEQHAPSHLIDFTSSLRSRDYSAGVHFYLDDCRFERVWHQPERYIPILKRFDCVFTPDFSLYMDMSMTAKIWNVYRSRLIGQVLQDAGIKVIPTVSWAEPASYQFCFDGIEPGGVVTVSSVGTFQSADSRKSFINGLKVMLKRLMPPTVILYGKEPNVDLGKTEIISFESTTWHWKSKRHDVDYKGDGNGR